ARRDVVIALIGEPAAILGDDPGAALLAAAVTESLVRRDARDEYVPRLAAQVPSLENGGLRVVDDRLVATFRLRSDLVWQDREPMHAGPFAVAAWVPGYGVTLSAFPRYALGAPALGRLEVRFFADRAAALEALRRGEVDVIPAGPLEPDLAPTLDRIADGSDR